MQYVQEAIYNDAQGIKISPQKTKPLPLPAILAEALEQHPMLMRMFDQTNPGKRNQYCAYIAEAKREETQQNRVQKVLEMLSKGEGLNDKYKK